MKAGINARCQMTLDCLAAAVKATIECTLLIIAGDLFDGVRPTPQIVRAVQKILDQMAPNFVLLGNHEFSSTDHGDHALGPLEPISDVITKPEIYDTENFSIIMVPFTPGSPRKTIPAAIDKLFAPATRAYKRPRILVTHAGIEHAGTPHYLTGSGIPEDELRSLCTRWDIDAAFSGDWHKRRVSRADGVPIVQIGALCPTGWDNPGESPYGSVIIYDTDTRVVTTKVIPGPRFIDVNSAEAVALLTGDDNSWFVRVNVPPDDTKHAIEICKTALANKTIAGFEVLPSGLSPATAGDMEALSDTVAVDDALFDFVAGMDISTTDAREVLRRARGYMG